MHLAARMLIFNFYALHLKGLVTLSISNIELPVNTDELPCGSIITCS